MKSNSPTQYEAKSGDEFKSRWIMNHTYIGDLPEEFAGNRKTINWVRC